MVAIHPAVVGDTPSDIISMDINIIKVAIEKALVVFSAHSAFLVANVLETFTGKEIRPSCTTSH